jgi:hypothetical protein
MSIIVINLIDVYIIIAIVLIFIHSFILFDLIVLLLNPIIIYILPYCFRFLIKVTKHFIHE